MSLGNYKIILIVIALVLIISAGTGHAYSVSGLVEFSYRDSENTIGNQKTSWNEFIQTYRISAETFVLDPRFLIVRGGVGYSIITDSGNLRRDDLSYDLSATLFQGMRYSGEFNASKFTEMVNPPAAPDYDLTTTMYGGRIVLNLSAAGRNGNNNNTNNNGNNFRNGPAYHFPLPDIVLEQQHTETDSTSRSVPQQETRDDTKAFIYFRPASNITLNLDGEIETYTNDVFGQSYDNKAVGLRGTWLVTPRSDLNVTGRRYERHVDNINGFTPEEIDNNINFAYHVQEINRLEQNYQYGYTKLENPVARSETHNGQARVWYRVNPSLRMFGGLNFGESDYVQFATALAPRQEYRLTQGLVDVGAAYSKIYAPEFLRPFLFHTDYEFYLGSTSVPQATNVRTGSGVTYGNDLGLGILSNGWSKESLTVDYRFTNKKDYSPASNDMLSHLISASLSTMRIPKLNIGINGSYTTADTSSNLPNNFTTLVAHSQLNRHQFQYTANADYTPTDFLMFTGGATRSRSGSQFRTLSTLGAPQNISLDETNIYAQALLNYNVTRQLDYHLQLRRDHRISQYGGTRRSDTDEFRQWLNYRIRRVFLSIEYRLRDYTEGTAPKVTEKYLFTRLSRPF